MSREPTHVNLSEAESSARISFEEILRMLHDTYKRDIRDASMARSPTPYEPNPYEVDIDVGRCVSHAKDVALLQVASSDHSIVIQPPTSLSRSFSEEKPASTPTFAKGLSVVSASGSSGSRVPSAPLGDLQIDDSWLGETQSGKANHRSSCMEPDTVRDRISRFVNTGMISEKNFMRSDMVTMTTEAASKRERKHIWEYDCIIHPAAKRKMVWDFVGFIFMMKDLIFIPVLMFFHTSTMRFHGSYYDFEHVFEGVATTYWSIDILVSFTTGYYNNQGFVELRVLYILRRYFRSWFLLDATLVVTDWLTFSAGDFSNAGILRFGKTVSRFMRSVKLLRFRKLSSTLKDLTERVSSEYIVTFIGVTKILCVIITLNHYIACGWYGLTRLQTDGKSWLSRIANDLTEKQKESMLYLYATSLHWSLTQFTPASMEVVPQNLVERSYNVVIIVVGVVAFSSLVSSVTGAMTYIRHINHKANEQNAMLRRFLRENSVSQDLATRIWHLRARRHGPAGYLTEFDVESLQRLPEDVLCDLRVELYLPKLAVHPMFFHAAKADVDASCSVCRSVIRCVNFLSVQEKYQKGKIMENMVFVLKGSLWYTSSAAGPLAFKIHKSLSGERASLSKEDWIQMKFDQWACEMALWLAEVRFPGSFRAAQHEKPLILTVAAKDFKEVAAQHPVAYTFLCKYAQKFCEGVLSNPEGVYADLICNDESNKGALHDIVNEVIHDLRSEIEESHSSASIGRTRSQYSMANLAPKVLHMFTGRKWTSRD